MVIETQLPTKWYKDEGGADKSLEANIKVVDANGKAAMSGPGRAVEISVTLLYEDDTEVRACARVSLPRLVYSARCVCEPVRQGVGVEDGVLHWAGGAWRPGRGAGGGGA